MKQVTDDNLIKRLSFEFSVKIIKYTEQLEAKRKFNLASQLFKSGTSIGANVNEAQSAESKNDFIHKMKIADKEAHETAYWLKLTQEMENYPKDEQLLNDLTVIMKVLNKIIATSKNSKTN